ncbi:uncharacterized protein LOC111866100 isoform X2 [Cryptotermes secundus]|uniref:uncharacterized protein LOC111866100 isoform X2 n=1 Tax=Cryptotermes secundus TaxID=105785 RepID=UPI000CD7D0EA|nr:uncharacterized protein LOC111866100 isoform X2 [Cryptotermes secundus]
MDEFKIESKSLNDSELKSPISEDANERISVVIPVVKCEAEIDLHIIKGEADTDDEIWPASSPNEDAKKEEQPAMFTFVSVNSKEESLRWVSVFDSSNIVCYYMYLLCKGRTVECCHSQARGIGYRGA